MKIWGNTVLITGGATGIGLAMAEEFVKAGSEVIICGRTEEALELAKDKLPSLHIKRCDVAKEAEREAFYEWAVANFRDLNVLVNNAGIQRMIDFRKGTSDLIRHRAEDGEDEIDVNLRALIIYDRTVHAPSDETEGGSDHQCLFGPCLLPDGADARLLCDKSGCPHLQPDTPSAAGRHTCQSIRADTAHGRHEPG